MRFISKKAAVPPLGLITVSAMLPSSWNKKLVDMNVSQLHTKDIIWADYVFISAMYIQKESVDKIVELCIQCNTKIVAGGPLFTQEYDNYPEIDHLVLNEAEITLPLYLKDLEEGHPQKVYKTNEYADLSLTPVPDYHLLSMKDYFLMNIQVTRGCPFACDFCEITALLGRSVRIKSSDQVINEMDTLYNLNYRGVVSIVDDNFIGNKYEIKNSLLPAMKEWMTNHKFPYTFTTETSINLADDEELMSLMTRTGFSATFVGIETPVESSLQECNKYQNKNRDLLQSVKKMQKAGFQVSAGFIVGFDNDTPSVFQKQIDFIQKSGIVTAMVGILNAPKNTKLYKRLEEENRLTVEATGNNTDSSMNFIPKMNYSDLIAGYKKIIQNIYSTSPYYKRIREFMLNYKKRHARQFRFEISYLSAFIKSLFILGILNKGRSEYWKLLIWTLIRRPNYLVEAVVFAIYGYHFRTVYGLRSNSNF
jgi:radical SAM superfamily enzyme YgiQ (UPF0313 family)